MSIGINFDCCKAINDIDEIIRLMKENGFTKTFCMADAPYVEEKIKKAQEAGIEFEFLHGSFSHLNDMWYDKPEGDKMLNELCENIKLCKKYNIPTLVVHLSTGRPAPLINDIGNSRYDKLMDCARDNGIKIAYENSRCLGNLAAALEKYDDAYFCWDVGHEVCFTPGMDFMPYFGNRIGALHLHDNMGVLDEDWHMLPFDGKNNMEKAAKELAKVKYDKCIMLEVSTVYYDGYKDMSPEEFYRRAGEAAKQFEKVFNEFL